MNNDKEIFDLILKEKERQINGLELIASKLRLYTINSSTYIHRAQMERKINPTTFQSYS